ncbi:hypothetical protein JW935_08120 [candidate division KSB1 bacterium]|nr:hypothetical protein [candidate division KSB1 bacterium]
MKRTLVFSSIAALFILNCTRDKLPEDVMFKVGNRYVTEKEFQYRARFTIHPNLPHANRNLENIFLNNMIMEKIIAEKFGRKSELNRNEGFLAYLQGRKEQAMREVLFYKKAFDIVKLDNAEIQKTMKLSQREYDLEFFNIYSDSTAKNLKRQTEASPQSALKIFDGMVEEYGRPSWTAKWKDPDHINIHEALYSAPLKADSIIGPLKLDDDHWIFMKVVNWRDEVNFGGEEQELRRQEVIEKLTTNRATRIWNAYTRDVMKGKEIEFDRDMFIKIADIFWDMLRTQDQKKNDMMRRLYQIEDSTLTASDLPVDEMFLQQQFFTIDGLEWTVGDFRRALMSHPLVYHKPAENKNLFYFEFRRAIAALVRDTYLNKEAYDMGLDKDKSVQRTTEIWSDALIATYERNRLLNELGKSLPDTTDPSRKIKLKKMLEEELADLKKEYDSKIRVDMDKFNQTEINKTQLFVTQQQLPYPVVVPGWPMFTNSNTIEYLPIEPRK